MPFQYTSFDEVPVEVVTFIYNLSGCEINVSELTLEEINEFMNRTEEFYTSNGQRIEDFLE